MFIVLQKVNVLKYVELSVWAAIFFKFDLFSCYSTRFFKLQHYEQIEALKKIITLFQEIQSIPEKCRDKFNKITKAQSDLKQKFDIYKKYSEKIKKL